MKKQNQITKINKNLRYFLWTLVGIVLLMGVVFAANIYSNSPSAYMTADNITINDTGFYANAGSEIEKLTKTADIVVCRGTNADEDETLEKVCDVVCKSIEGDCGSIINNINYNEGDTIYFKNGIYPIQTTIQFTSKEVNILGDYRGSPTDRTKGTILNWTNVSGNILLNFTTLRNFQVSNIKLLGNGVGSVGIQAGLPNGGVTTKPKNLVFENIVIDNFSDTNLKLGYDNAGGSAVDSELRSVHLRYGGKCIDYVGQMVNMYGGTVGGCNIGVYARRNSNMNFFGTSFSTNDIHFLYDNATVGTYSLHGVWLEGTTETILKQNTSSGSEAVIHHPFECFGCYISGGSGDNLFNFTNMTIDVMFQGGRVNSAVNKEIILGTNTNIFENFVNGQFQYVGDNQNKVYRFSGTQLVTPNTWKLSEKTAAGTIDILSYRINNIPQFGRPIGLTTTMVSASGSGEGAIAYNSSLKVPLFSNGTDWLYFNGTKA